MAYHGVRPESTPWLADAVNPIRHSDDGDALSGHHMISLVRRYAFGDIIELLARLCNVGWVLSDLGHHIVFFNRSAIGHWEMLGGWQQAKAAVHRNSHRTRSFSDSCCRRDRAICQVHL